MKICSLTISNQHQNFSVMITDIIHPRPVEAKEDSRTRLRDQIETEYVLRCVDEYLSGRDDSIMRDYYEIHKEQMVSRSSHLIDKHLKFFFIRIMSMLLCCYMSSCVMIKNLRNLILFTDFRMSRYFKKHLLKI